MNQEEYGNHIGRSAAWVRKLIRIGTISKASLKTIPGRKKPLIIVAKADEDMAKVGDASRDTQREANAKRREDSSLLNPKNQLPIECTVAGMTDEEKAQKAARETKEREHLEELKKEAKLEQLENTPDIDDSQAEWNKYWIMERGLKTALERKKLQGSLIDVNEAKGLVEKFMSPIVQKLDHMAYDIKTRFPLVDDSVVEYVADYIDSVKRGVQKNVF